ncbi:MAG: glycosyltransferase family 39 protein [Anaerolineae bacterium]
MSRLLVLAQWVIRVFALLVAVRGGALMFESPIRSEQTGLDVGAPYLLAAFLIWLVSELIPVARTERRGQPQARRREAVLVLSPTRLIALASGAVTSVLAWTYNGGNLFTVLGVIAWVASIILWVWALAPEGWTPIYAVQVAWYRLRTTRIRITWTLLALIVIMAFGAYFRLVDLNGAPPEMTSDHVEKLLDVNRVLHGATNVFFANNHGRDAIQFYSLALLSYLPGLELNFTLLKLLTVIEGLITLPVLWWMGREVIGRDDPRLGNAVGLALAALVAVSYWHEMLSRLGLRIVLTPLFVALIMIFLARAVRYNRRSDFIYTGLALGVGLYAYQAIRMMPLAVLVAVGIAFIFGMRSMRDRGHMLVNLAALVIVAFAIFVPLFRYDTEYPEDFWRRTYGRLFGDDVTQTTDENGNLVMRAPVVGEVIAAFDQNIPAFGSNFRNALLMYNWKGDVAWINNAPNQPAFDPVSGGLLIVGIGAWLARMMRRRDSFDWALLPLILVMMLPSALAIAYPIENPSATRMSGTLPGVYLLAALPLALLALALPRLIGRVGTLVAVVGVGAVVLVSYGVNSKTYFEDYKASYTANSLPYSVGGEVLRSFAAEHGYGNAFILAYPYWWDHRALGIDAGRIDWSNTITSLSDIPKYLAQAMTRQDEYKLDVNSDLLFFYSSDDVVAQEWLQANFPGGYWENVTTYQPSTASTCITFRRSASTGSRNFWRGRGLKRLSVVDESVVESVVRNVPDRSVQ